MTYVENGLPAQVALLISESKWDELVELLTDLEIIEATCRRDGIKVLAECYDLAVDAASRGKAPQECLARLLAFRAFLRQRAFAFADSPDSISEEAYNFEPSGPVRDAGVRYLARAGMGHPWIRQVTGPGNRQADSLAGTLKSRFDKPDDLQISPDGRFAAALLLGGYWKDERENGLEKVVQVWNLRTCLEACPPLRHELAVTRLSFCRDGGDVFLATAQNDGQAFLWQPLTGEKLWPLTGHQAQIFAMGGSGTAGLVATGDKDGFIRLWSARTGECLGSACGHVAGVLQLAFTPDARYLLSTGDDNQMKLWDTAGLVCIWDGEVFAPKHSARSIEVKTLALSGDGRLLATGVKMGYGGNLVGAMGKVRVWDLETGRCLKALEGHTKGVICLAFSRDGKSLLTGGFDQLLRVWDLETGRCLDALEGHKYYLRCIAVSPDGRLAISGSFYDRVILWDLESRTQIAEFEDKNGLVERLAFTPDGSIAIGSGFYGLMAIDVARRKLIYYLPEDHDTCILRLRADELGELSLDIAGVIPDECFPGEWQSTPGSTLAIRSGKGFIDVWDLSRSKFDPDRSHERDYDLYRQFSFSGCTLLGINNEYGDSDAVDVVLWDVIQNRQIRAFKGHDGRVEHACFTPDGRGLVTASGDGTVKVWDLDSGKCRLTLPGHMDIGARISQGSAGRQVSPLDWTEPNPCIPGSNGKLTCPGARFGPGADLAVAEAEDGSLAIFHVDSCRRVNRLAGKADAGALVRYSADGKFLVAAGPASPDRRPGKAKAVSLVERATGAVAGSSPELDDPIRQLQGDETLGTVITSHKSGEVRVWHLHAGAGMARSPAERPLFAVTPDGRFLLSQDGNSLKIYDLSKAELPPCDGSPVRRQLVSPMPRESTVPVSLDASPDGSVVVAAGMPGHGADLLVLDPATSTITGRLSGHASVPGSVLTIFGGKGAISGGYDSKFTIWDLRSLRPIESARLRTEYYRIVAMGENNLICQITFGSYFLIDLEKGTGREMRRSEVIPEQFVGLLDGGRRLVSRSAFSIAIYDLRTAKLDRLLEGHTDVVTHCALHEKTGRIVSSQWTGDQSLALWSLSEGKIVARLGGHTGAITDIVVTPDGRYALSGSEDKTVRVWDLEERRCVRVHHLDGPITFLSSPQPNGVFIVSTKSYSRVLQLCR